LTAVQLLWLNLIMDTLAALALATEKPDADCLTDPPFYKQGSVISNRMKVFVVGHALFQCGIMFLHLFSSYIWLDTVEGDCYTVSSSAQLQSCSDICTQQGGTFRDERYCQQGDTHATILFNIFIWMQVFNMFNARMLKRQVSPFTGLWSRGFILLVITLIIALFQVFAVELAGAFMQTVRLNGEYWGVSIAFGATELPFGLLLRLLEVEDSPPDQVRIKWAREETIRKNIGLGNSTSSRGVTPTGRKHLFARRDLALRRGTMVSH
jgi:Ca2+-transporting ATPase